MKAADRLSQALGSHINESVGAGRSTVDHAASPFPTSGMVHGGPGAEKYKGAARLKDAFAIELERLMPDPSQPRKEFDPEELERLAASLRTRGQLQPIRVRYDESGGRWVIVAGERRFRAASLAGLSTLVCVEAKGALTADDILEDQIVENCLREDLKPVEQAHAFKMLIDRRGCSQRQLAEALSISHQQVVRALSLLDLPGDIRGKIDAGMIRASTAAEVARIGDENEQREMIAEIEAGTMTRDDVAKVVRSRLGKSRGGKSKPRPPVDGRSRRMSNGVKVCIDATHKHTLDDVRAALRELLDRLGAEDAQEAA
jgi:ParB family chromosome partitioning protein